MRDGDLCCAGSLDKVSVQIEGQTYPLKKVAQLGMPNPQTIAINMSAYPEVGVAGPSLLVLPVRCL